jgi:ring-1,2-phenylacetyl-CoA epoxidase subunit PaaD
MSVLSTDAVWKALEEVSDPEIPTLSVVDLGIIRSVGVDGETVTVAMTPTFAGCPALAVMRAEIKQRLLAAGAQRVEVRLVLAPPWSSDWITSRGRAQLRAAGLAPPPYHGGAPADVWDAPAVCPYCGSQDTRVTNNFGSTLCRSIYVCDGCRQPFEQFKPL